MPYCTMADVEAAYGKEAILTAQPRAVPEVDPLAVDTAAVDAAIEAATDEIDSYVMARYSLPLADELADRLKRRCVDMAMYSLSPSVSGQDDEKRKRYDDAVAWLKMVAEGEVVLTPRPAASITSDEPRGFEVPTNYLPAASPYYHRRRGRFD